MEGGRRASSSACLSILSTEWMKERKIKFCISVFSANCQVSREKAREGGGKRKRNKERRNKGRKTEKAKVESLYPSAGCRVEIHGKEGRRERWRRAYLRSVSPHFLPSVTDTQASREPHPTQPGSGDSLECMAQGNRQRWQGAGHRALLAASSCHAHTRSFLSTSGGFCMVRLQQLGPTGLYISAVVFSIRITHKLWLLFLLDVAKGQSRASSHLQLTLSHTSWDSPGDTAWLLRLST